VALLRARVPADDPLIQRCLKYLRSLPPEQTYTVGLQTMAFCLAGQKQDRDLVQRNIKWLTTHHGKSGWGYDVATMRSTDHSNTSFAILGLLEAHRAGYKIDTSMLRELRDYYAENRTGQWNYPRAVGPPTLTMTTAGLVNLLSSIEMLDKKKTAQEEKSIELGLKWLGENFPADIQKAEKFPHAFYCLHGIRVLGDRTGQRLLGKHDWYQVGSKYLLETQKPNGSWSHNDGLDQWPPVATSFALLFLVPDKK
jgi:hypothetical protein